MNCIGLRHFHFGLAAALLAVFATSAVAQDAKANEGAGLRIQMGAGHFDKAGKAFHDWDKEKEIPAPCARCHAVDGLVTYLKDGKNVAAPHVKNGFACTTCHADMVTYARYPVPKVTFPGGVSVDSGNANTNLCMTCHQGRESTASVNKAIAGLEADVPNPKIAFLHVHYLPAGATQYGTDVKVGYEYAGKTYAGRFMHAPGVDSCTTCHDVHSAEVHTEICGNCHAQAKATGDVQAIRMSKGDFDGNGREEGIAREVANEKAELYVAIQQYARNVGGVPLAFSREAFPYWYADTNGNGKIDADELRPDNAYKAFTPRLLQAVYNYTFALRDPGAAYHNGRYTLQLLYDSIDSLAQSGKVSASVQGKVRP